MCRKISESNEYLDAKLGLQKKIPLEEMTYKGKGVDTCLHNSRMTIVLPHTTCTHMLALMYNVMLSLSLTHRQRDRFGEECAQ